MAVYDQSNRWLFDDINVDGSLLSHLGEFPFEEVPNLKEFLNEQKYGSLRPRAVKGIDMIDVDIVSAKKIIMRAFPKCRVSSSKEGVASYGASLSVSLVDHGSGRASVYANGVEPYSNSVVDGDCAKMIALSLLDGTSARLRDASSLDALNTSKGSTITTELKR